MAEAIETIRDSEEKDTARKILSAGRSLFARHGYDGVSVRDICREAGSNTNAVHYHFESKSKLFSVILRQFSEEMLASARRALASTPLDASEFRTRLQIFLEEMLTSFLANRDLVMIVHVEFLNGSPRSAPLLDPEVARSLSEYPRFLGDFFARARDAKILKTTVDPEILAQLVMKPALTMVLNCPASADQPEQSIENPEYRAHWTNQVLLVLLDGVLVD